MSNVNRPAGLSVARHVGGGSANRLERYSIASAGAFDIFRGDAVVPTATSKNIARPTGATDRLQGVFNGCFYILPTGEPKYAKRWPTGQVVQTGSTTDAWVYDDADTLFEIQGDEDLVLADIGALADLVIGAGNTSTEISADMLDSSTIGTGAVFKIRDYTRRPDNELATNYTKVLVTISKHYLGGPQTAI